MKLTEDVQDRADVFLLKLCIFFVWLLFFITGHHFAQFYYDKAITLVAAVASGFLGLLIGISLSVYILREAKPK